MAINYTVSYTFTPNTIISSSEVNTNFSDNSNVWTGLEAKTKSLAALLVDATPTSATDVAIKSYVDKLNNYRRPVLQYSSATVVNLETGINGTSGQAQILFPDGTLRTDSTASRINFDITRNCALSGSAQSGLRATLSETTNTWYALYAVKVSDSTTNFVVVGDTVLPLQANYSTLNSNFGSNSWVYLGLIRNGDNSAATADILNFVQVGNTTYFLNVVASGATNSAIASTGLQMATTAGATTLTYSTSSGTGATNVPANVSHALWNTLNASVAGNMIVRNSGDTITYFINHANSASGTRQHMSPASAGVKLSNGPASSIAYDIHLTGVVDSVLGVGANPLL